MPIKFLCYGSVNIDQVYSVHHIVKQGSPSSIRFIGRRDTENPIYMYLPWRKSVALARTHPHHVYHFGKVGVDGTWILELMQSQNVNISNVIVDPTYNTGKAIIQLSEDGNNAILLDTGTNTRLSQNDHHLMLKALDGMDVLVIQNEVSENAFVVAEASNRGMQICFNPAPFNEQCGFLEKDGKGTRVGFMKFVHVLIVNEGEAKALFNSFRLFLDLNDCGDFIAKIEQLKIRLNALRILVITLGEKGSVCAFLDSLTQRWMIIEQEAIKVTVIDTTGAGDSFVGFFLSQLTSGDDWVYSQERIESALKVATVAAGLCCKIQGAMSSIPRRVFVEKEMNAL